MVLIHHAGLGVQTKVAKSAVRGLTKRGWSVGPLPRRHAPAPQPQRFVAGSAQIADRPPVDVNPSQLGTTKTTPTKEG